ncbi:hypothetical protein MMC30_000192 [Trapelia coarctata]|nr:hypothetical protein [Trapelia coarctata]
MSAPLPKIYTHPSPRQTLLPNLLPLLPYTLPLVRRIQFHFQSPYAHVLSTIDPSAPTPPSTENDIPQAEHSNGTASTSTTAPTAPATPFLVTYLDRSRAPETECWLFSSIELPSSPISPEESVLAHAQLLALLQHIKALPLPPDFPSSHPRNLLLAGSVHLRVLELLKGEKVREGEGRKVLSGSVEEWKEQATVGNSKLIPNGSVSNNLGDDEAGRACSNGEENGRAVIPSVEANPDKDLIHGSTDPHGENARGFVRGHTVPTMKFLFEPGLCTDPAVVGGRGDVPGGRELPGDLEWDVVRGAEYALVKSRTAIPRQDRTMRLLGSVGVRTRVGGGAVASLNGDSGVMGSGDCGGGRAGGSGNRDGAREGDTQRGDLIAWAFLGPDGSLTTLHVEPAFRGRGIAKMLTRRLFGLLAPTPAPADAAQRGSETERLRRLDKLREMAAGWASGIGETNSASAASEADDPTPAHPPNGGNITNPPSQANPLTAAQNHTDESEPQPGQGGIPRSGFVDIRLGEEWAHSDVYIDNLESAGVARSLGGGDGWWVFWAWLDLGV